MTRRPSHPRLLPAAHAVIALLALAACHGSTGGSGPACGAVDGMCPERCAFPADGDCPEPASYYVAPSGNDDATGDALHPFRTFERAHSVVEAGDLVYFREGTHHPRDPTRAVNALRGRSGAPGKLIRFWAYPGERVVLDFSTLSNTTSVVRALDFTGDYWHWKGIDVTGVPQYAGQTVSIAFVARNAHHNVFERMRFRDNAAIGFALSGSSDDNLVLNCDAYNNQDPLDGYEDANGFMSATDEGTTNTFRGCRAWWNCDDGFDHFNGDGVVVHEDCWAFWNGYRPGTFEAAGNGMGFKLGKSTYTQGRTTRVATRCLAYRNLAFGFDQNALRDAVELQHCSAYRNQYGIRLPHRWDDYTPLHVVRGCLAYGNGTDAVVNPGSTDDHNSWNSGVTVTDQDFLSVDPAGIDGPRRFDGSLPDLDFLKLAPGSDLVDKGVDVGLPYLGAAPDLGAFERE